MKFTFGNSPAANRLEVLVEESPIARRQVSTLLSIYTNQLLHITGAKDQRTVHLCMEMLRDNTLRRIDVKRNLTTEMKTYLKNVVVMRYRVYRRGFDDVINIANNQKKP